MPLHSNVQNQRALRRLATISQKLSVIGGVQLATLEKAKQKEAHGEFESEHLGYRGAQDTLLSAI